ncbi:MAG: SbcC/MukB-like Walker B domain-containing protein, partial [Solirubrobacteraceae bacterium]
GLAAEVEERQRLLNTREREILENHLVGEVASALQELIVAAEQRVRDTNAELAARPTSTGMQLRLRWITDPDAPDGLSDARTRLLRQSTDAWSEDDRAAVGGFLQHQIRAARAGDEAGTWLELLTRAFDYRHWHRFSVERRQAGGWQPASGPSSGGERVLAASVPLFAAASSYYSSAGNPHAPRLVMLDEAFAGVDDRARAKCLGLLAAFDLDVVMTSEREWGCYAEVPGLAIAQLSRIDGVAAVLVTGWEWDGFQRTRVPDEPEHPTVAALAPADGAQLWNTSTTSD